MGYCRICKSGGDAHLNLLQEIANGDTGDTLLSTTPQKNTALHMAAMLGHQEFAEDFLRKCSSLLRQANAQGDTALHYAARAGNLNIVVLLTNHQDVQQRNGVCEADEEAQGSLERMKNSKDNTALHEALINGYTHVALYLLEIDDCLCEIVNKAGESPLFLAARRGLTEVVEKIVSTGRPFSQDGPNGQTPLHAAVIGIYPGTVKLLLEKIPGVITCVDSLGSNALHYATERKSFGTMELLLTENKKLGYIINKANRSPLLIAVHLRCPCTVEVILKHCPDSVELLDEEGRNVLHIAASANDVSMVKRLVNNPLVKVLINGRDKEENTPLHLANKKDLIHVEMLLLEVEGIDLMASNKEGVIASSWRYTTLMLRPRFLYQHLKFGRVLNNLKLPLIDSYDEWTNFAWNLYSLNSCLAVMAMVIALNTPVNVGNGVWKTLEVLAVASSFIASVTFLVSALTIYKGIAASPDKLKPAVRRSSVLLTIGFFLALPGFSAILPATIIQKILPAIFLFNSKPPEPASYIA